jgi:hypothetical protein
MLECGSITLHARYGYNYSCLTKITYFYRFEIKHLVIKIPEIITWRHCGHSHRIWRYMEMADWREARLIQAILL